MDDWLRSEAGERVPMAFLYGAGDARTAGFTKALVEGLRRADKDALHKYTTILAVEGTALAGSQLLEPKALGVAKKVVNYLNNVLPERRQIVRPRPDARRPPPLIAVEQFGIR